MAWMEFQNLRKVNHNLESEGAFKRSLRGCCPSASQPASRSTASSGGHASMDAKMLET